MGGSEKQGRQRKERRGNKTEETADISDICAWLACAVFSHYLTEMVEKKEEEEEEGTKSAYQIERLQQFPYYSYCNHFNPSPVCVPGCVDMAKRCDASYCMTNYDELIHLSMVSFLNKPTGSVCISPIQWLSNSLQQNLSSARLSRFCPHLKLTGSPISPPFPSMLYLFLPLSFLLCHSIFCVLL